MRAIFGLCALILVAGAAFTYRACRLPDKFGEFTGVPKAEVADLVHRPKDYLRKTVAVEGVVREQCTTMGCYFFFLSGKERLRVDISEVAMTAPRRNGRQARVEGRIVPYGDGYQFWASAVEFQ